MQMPVLDDTIIAVSSAWHASPLGIVRLSGPNAFELLAGLGPPPRTAGAAHPCCYDSTLVIEKGLRLPATVLAFRSPRSYTGQDVVEIHTVGSLPLLRALAASLIEQGARRALPGEFTARAFLSGRLDARQVEAVFTLINAEDETAARRAARMARQSRRKSLAKLDEQLTELIALVEAGIDFVEEEDVHFITPEELIRSIDALIGTLPTIREPGGLFDRFSKPHVALAGLPNAGKSTLFNCLVGYERAIVAPVLGTTRDVLSAEIEVDGVAFVLQDCAGRGYAADELESAAHLAAEQAADQADLVLWLHEQTASWDRRETEACRRIPAHRRVLVLSKLDQPARMPDLGSMLPFRAVVGLSALTGTGLAHLRRTLVDCLARECQAHPVIEILPDPGAVARPLERARDLASSRDGLAMPEVVALELRHAWDALEWGNRGPLVESVLAKIFTQFCIGK